MSKKAYAVLMKKFEERTLNQIEADYNQLMVKQFKNYQKIYLDYSKQYWGSEEGRKKLVNLLNTYYSTDQEKYYQILYNYGPILFGNRPQREIDAKNEHQQDEYGNFISDALRSDRNRGAKRRNAGQNGLFNSGKLNN